MAMSARDNTSDRSDAPFASPSGFDWIAEATQRLRKDGLLRHLVERDGPQGAQIMLAGQRLINFGANDYLGLANHPSVKAAAAQAIDEFGWGSGASPLVLGYTQAQRELEEAIAARKRVPSSVLFPTGYAANLGTIVALAGKGDAIFSDAKNHASIVDGCRLSRASVTIYDHADVAQLESQLANDNSCGRRLIVSDGLFSMDGDVAPLERLAELADSFGAMLMVDEAHATGVLGCTGCGASELARVESCSNLVRTGTLSKAWGSVGGFCIGPKTLTDWIRNRARSYIFSTAAPAAVCRAAVAAIRTEKETPERRTDLLASAKRVRSELKRQGWNTGNSTSQIIPVLVGAPEKAVAAAKHLRHLGLFVPAIRPPSVPHGESLLRVSLTAEHTPAMLERLLDGFASLASMDRAE